MARTKEQEDAWNEIAELDGKAAIVSHKIMMAVREGRPREELEKMEQEIARLNREARKLKQRVDS